MTPSQFPTASDAGMSDSPINDADADVTAAAATSLDAQDMDDTVDPSEEMVEAYVGNPSSSNLSALKSSDDLSDPQRDPSDDQTVQIDYHGDTAAPNGNATDTMEDVRAEECGARSKGIVEVDRDAVGQEQTEMMGEVVEEGGEEGAGEVVEEAVEETAEEDVEEDIQDGAEEGTEEGMEEGAEEGMEEGVEEGAEDNMEEGVEEGAEEGAEETIGEAAEEAADEVAEGTTEVVMGIAEPKPDQPLLQHVAATIPNMNTIAVASAEQPSSAEEENIQTDKVIEADIAARAEQVTLAAVASAAGLSAVAASSGGMVTSGLQSMGLPGGIATMGAPFGPFGPLAPNGAALMAHPLVSMPMSIGRRAVRIAPMGVLPLPPQGGAVVPEMGGQGSGGGMSGGESGGGGGGGGGDVQMGGGGGGGAGVIGEMHKGKRRGVSGGAQVSTEGMSQEERTKQKRMLRNRESAARSRDKRKTKNIQLEASISSYNEKRAAIEHVIGELQEAVDSMQQVLKKHNVALPC